MKKLKGKKAFLAAVALVLAAALGMGIFFAARGKGEPVPVYPFTQVGMTEYWGDNQESYGPVSTDRIQTVFLSDTQIVTEILVKEGDTVKKGDVLMTFDTTLSDLALERKRLEVEKLKLQLTQANNELARIRGMKPMVIPETIPDEGGDDVDEGYYLEGAYQISTALEYDGSAPERALICWLNTDATLNNTDMLEAIRVQAEALQNQNLLLEPSSGSAPEDLSEGGDANGGDLGESQPEGSQPEGTQPEGTQPEGTQPEGTQPEGTQPGETQPGETQPGETQPGETQPGETQPGETQPGETQPGETQPGETQPGETQPGETVPPEHITVTSCYVVFKVTENNMSLGSRTAWQGVRLVGSGSEGFRMYFFNGNIVPDHMLLEEEEIYEDMEGPQIDFGSGYTAAQIAQMRSEQEKKIQELEFNIKIADADYKIMQTEMNDGTVESEIDGQVISVLTEQEAKDTKQPVVKVSGGGGFYIQGVISELERENLQIGQEVTVNDWNSGGTYTGTVKSVGDFPSLRDGYTGMGNPNTSYYPFTVFVDGTADLQADRYVSVQYSTGSGQTGIYLQNPFLRTENGQSFVYVRGAGGKLEKRIVTTGKSLWGNYTQILSGLSEEDLVAFPYGKNVKEGASTVEGDVADLYQY